MNQGALQVLIVTMNQTDHSLLNKMNIDSDALIGNQCDVFKKEDFNFNGHNVSFYSWNERGVGLNRNNLLMRANSEIVLFSDDDVIYDANYENIVLQAFHKYPKADVIIFNVIPLPETINPCLVKSWHRIRWYNCLKYGAVRIAARLDKLREANVNFSLLFGGGAKFSSGEDSLFLIDCIKSGLKVYGYPARIGTVQFETSSWFRGYNEKYFMDKGVFFYFLSKKFSKLLCLQYCLRCSHLFKDSYTKREAYQLMKKGIKLFKLGEF